jgi:hypothetical protein
LIQFINIIVNSDLLVFEIIETCSNSNKCETKMLENIIQKVLISTL